MTISGITQIFTLQDTVVSNVVIRTAILSIAKTSGQRVYSSRDLFPPPPIRDRSRELRHGDIFQCSVIISNYVSVIHIIEHGPLPYYWMEDVHLNCAIPYATLFFPSKQGLVISPFP